MARPGKNKFNSAPKPGKESKKPDAPVPDGKPHVFVAQEALHVIAAAPGNRDKREILGGMHVTVAGGVLTAEATNGHLACKTVVTDPITLGDLAMDHVIPKATCKEALSLKLDMMEIMPLNSKGRGRIVARGGRDNAMQEDYKPPTGTFPVMNKLLAAPWDGFPRSKSKLDRVVLINVKNMLGAMTVLKKQGAEVVSMIIPTCETEPVQFTSTIGGKQMQTVLAVMPLTQGDLGAGTTSKPLDDDGKIIPAPATEAPGEDPTTPAFIDGEGDAVPFNDPLR